MDSAFVPPDFEIPVEFAGTRFHLEPLGPEHNERDHEAWMSSIEHIRSTPGMDGGEWPAPMSLDENMADMEMHAREFVGRTSFTYSVLDGEDIVGCVYIYPSKEPDQDAHVRSWVRASRAELDRVVWQEVGGWLTAAWPFRSFIYAPR